MSQIRHLIAFVLGFSIVSSPASSDDLLPVPDLIQNFYRTAFGAEQSLSADSNEFIRKWLVPIRPAIYTDNETLLQRKGAKGLVNRFFSSLSERIDGVQIELIVRIPLDIASDLHIVGDVEQINFRIIFYDDARIVHQAKERLAQWHASFERYLTGRLSDQLGGRNTCSTSTWSGRNGGDGIGFALVLIPLRHPREILAECIEEEIAQSLGLLNDSNLNTGSMFNDLAESPSRLTVNDLLLLRVLYDQRIGFGETRDEVGKKLPIIVKEHRERLASEMQ